MPSLSEAKQLILDNDLPLAANALAGKFTGYTIKSIIHDPFIPSLYVPNGLLAAQYTLKFDRHSAIDVFNCSMWSRSKAHQQAIFIAQLSECLAKSGAYRFDGTTYCIPVKDARPQDYPEYTVDEFYGYGYANVHLPPDLKIHAGMIELPKDRFEEFLKTYKNTVFENMKQVCKEENIEGTDIINFPVPFKAMTSITFSIVAEI